MEVTQLAAAGSVLTCLITLVGFFIAQGSNLRKLIEAGDASVRDSAGRAREELANQVKEQLGNLERDLKALQQAAYRRDEAREMEARFVDRFNRFDTKLDAVVDKLASLDGLRVELRNCLDGVKELNRRLDAREKVS